MKDTSDESSVASDSSYRGRWPASGEKIYGTAVALGSPFARALFVNRAAHAVLFMHSNIHYVRILCKAVLIGMCTKPNLLKANFHTISSA